MSLRKLIAVVYADQSDHRPPLIGMGEWVREISLEDSSQKPSEELNVKDVNVTPRDFPDKRLLRGFEGGGVYTAEQDGRYYLISDEGTMADFLSDEDLAGMVLTHAWEFESEAERRNYAIQRGWMSEHDNREGRELPR